MANDSHMKFLQSKMSVRGVGLLLLVFMSSRKFNTVASIAEDHEETEQEILETVEELIQLEFIEIIEIPTKGLPIESIVITQVGTTMALMYTRELLDNNWYFI